MHGNYSVCIILPKGLDLSDNCVNLFEWQAIGPMQIERQFSMFDAFRFSFSWTVVAVCIGQIDALVVDVHLENIKRTKTFIQF